MNSETDLAFQAIASDLYSTTPYQYGYSMDPTCASGYYPGTVRISKEEVDAVQNFMQRNGILPENTRVSKCQRGDSPSSSFSLHVASAEVSWKPEVSGSTVLDLPMHPTISVVPGDFGDCLERVIKELQCAAIYSTGDAQNVMIEALIKSFQSGDHLQFKDAQSHWIRDRSPIVETVIGFIETYQDPHGVRGAWEGIVAIVNRDRSRKFSELVERSTKILSLLPWNGKSVGLEDEELSAFESSLFVKPDFTSLDSTFSIAYFVFPLADGYNC